MPTPANGRAPGSRKKSVAERMRSEEKTPTRHGYFHSFDGTRLFYSIEGEGKPIVFCYGLVCSSLHWTYQIEHFSRKYQSIWFDYRGHHNSDPPRDLNSLTIETLARDMGILLDELKIEDAVFMGHSMGVNIVLEFYRQQPERVKGLVLANGTAGRPLETLFHVNVLQAGFKFLKRVYDTSPGLVSLLWKMQKGNPVSRKLMTFAGFNPYLTPEEDVALYLDQIAEMDPRILIHLIQNYDKYDATAWLHTVKAPTLIVAGENDMAIPIYQQELMHQLIPDSRLEIIRHGSHCPQMDLPELFDHKIENFLAEIGYHPKDASTKEATPSKSPGQPEAEPVEDQDSASSLKTETASRSTAQPGDPAR